VNAGENSPEIEQQVAALKGTTQRIFAELIEKHSPGVPSSCFFLAGSRAN
jgi:hypothetical protein